jgi:hypothetical protein
MTNLSAIAFTSPAIKKVHFLPFHEHFAQIVTLHDALAFLYVNIWALGRVSIWLKFEFIVSIKSFQKLLSFPSKVLIPS